MKIKSLTGVDVFLKMPEPEKFDFKDLMKEYYEYYADKHMDDTAYLNLLDKLPVMADNDAVEKWFQYKTLDENLSKGKLFDCDSSNGTCHLSEQIYKVLWGYGVVEAFHSISFGGDTMNSFATILDDFADAHSLRECREKYNSNPNYKKLIDDIFGSYAAATGRIGNFVLVPKGYNKSRNNRFKDFWDRSLAFLQSTDNQYLLEGEFTKYINYFFLWDYVYLRDEANYGVRSMQSKAFTETRGYSGPSPELNSIMPSEDEIPVFLGNAISAINRRGIFMTAMLRLASELPEAYKRLRDKVYISAKPYSGYGAVIEAIRDELGWIPDGLEILQ